MKDIFPKVAATVIAAVILAAGAAFYSINARLTRIETHLEYFIANKNKTAANAHEN
jgi:hypothetical protein